MSRAFADMSRKEQRQYFREQMQGQALHEAKHAIMALLLGNKIKHVYGTMWLNADGETEDAMVVRESTVYGMDISTPEGNTKAGQELWKEALESIAPNVQLGDGLDADAVLDPEGYESDEHDLKQLFEAGFNSVYTFDDFKAELFVQARQLLNIPFVKRAIRETAKVLFKRGAPDRLSRVVGTPVPGSEIEAILDSCRADANVIVQFTGETPEK